jgi:hypothetical protein
MVVTTITPTRAPEPASSADQSISEREANAQVVVAAPLICVSKNQPWSRAAANVELLATRNRCTPPTTRTSTEGSVKKCLTRHRAIANRAAKATADANCANRPETTRDARLVHCGVTSVTTRTAPLIISQPVAARKPPING